MRHSGRYWHAMRMVRGHDSVISHVCHSGCFPREQCNLCLVETIVHVHVHHVHSIQDTVPLAGRTWAIAESIEPGELEDLSSPIPLPPAVVSEHAQLPRRFILLTTQGSYMFTKRRPVDQLQLLLEACRSGSGEAIDGFFKLQSVSDPTSYTLSHSGILSSSSC